MKRPYRGPKSSAQWQTIGGQKCYFRSRWEVNYARILQYWVDQGTLSEWVHEPHTFWFDGIKRGTVSYLPDFLVTWPDGRSEYHEVKGRMDARSRTKLKRMAKYHSDVVLVLIAEPEYNRLAAEYRPLIPEWQLSKSGKA